MKLGSISVAALAILLMSLTAVAKADAGSPPTTSPAENSGTVHQTLAGDKLTSGDGKNAVDKGEMEVKKIDGAQSESGQVARAKGSEGQWSFVVAWFGLPAPEGKSIIRLRVYFDGEKTSQCFLYTRDKDGSTLIGPVKIPDDAKKDTFVTVDVPVDAKAEWGGLVIKKAEKSDLPGPWIDTASIVLPN